jgi:hypothetical protein
MYRFLSKEEIIGLLLQGYENAFRRNHTDECCGIMSYRDIYNFQADLLCGRVLAGLEDKIDLKGGVCLKTSD